MTSRDLIDLDFMPLWELSEILDLAGEIIKNPRQYEDACKGKVLATLFYEPSTRTQMSFQTAMLRLGGRIIGFDNPGNSSVSKGESLKDTVRVVSGYADIIVIRHPLEGTALAASMYSKSPIVNAGDGGHLHPTQTLTDLVTLSQEKGSLSGLTIGLCGDLRNGRTVHSLIKTMTRFEGNRFVLISTKELSVPQYIRDCIVQSGSEYTEAESLNGAIGQLDVLYMTRIQKERFKNAQEYEKQKGVFVLDEPKLAKAKRNLKILHPLPRIDEISVDIDDDPRAIYFEQAEYGMYARMALIMKMLETGEKLVPLKKRQTHDCACKNKACITNYESYIPKRFSESGDMLVCKYCEERLLL